MSAESSVAYFLQLVPHFTHRTMKGAASFTRSGNIHLRSRDAGLRDVANRNGVEEAVRVALLRLLRVIGKAILVSGLIS